MAIAKKLKHLNVYVDPDVRAEIIRTQNEKLMMELKCRSDELWGKYLIGEFFRFVRRIVPAMRKHGYRIDGGKILEMWSLFWHYSQRTSFIKDGKASPGTDSWSDEALAYLIELRSNGATYDEIDEELGRGHGCSRSAVQRYGLLPKIAEAVKNKHRNAKKKH